MVRKYQSRRSIRKLARKSRKNFIVSLVLIGLLVYAAFQWILPSLINGVGFIHNIVKPSKKIVSQDAVTIAPPVLSIPFEATNTAQIYIHGYGAPNSKVEIFLDGDKKDTISVLDNGNFEFKNVQLSLGTNNIYGKSVDDKDQESLPSKTFVVIYDNEDPKLDISSPEDNKHIQGGDKKVTVSGNTEPGAQIFINGSQTIVDKDGNFKSDQMINEGDNNLTISAVDSAANKTEVQRKVTYTP